MSKRTGFVTDADLIANAHPSAWRVEHLGGQASEAMYADGTVIYWAVGGARRNRTYAREYGTRILGSPLVSCNRIEDTDA
jgi:hypothetical protein